MCALTESFPSLKDSILLIRMDASGNIEWTRSLEGEDVSQPETMIASSDGGFLVVGYANNHVTDNSDIEVIKFDGAGGIEWVGLYGGASTEYAYGVAHSADGAYLVTGSTNSYRDTTRRSIFVMKLSPTGELLWLKLIGGLSGNSAGYSVA